MTPFEQQARDLLDKAAKKFRLYEDQHRGKITPLRLKLTETKDESEKNIIEALIDSTYEKSKVNGTLAHEIETVLNEHFLTLGVE